jgi:hypothetical protein
MEREDTEVKIECDSVERRTQSVTQGTVVDFAGEILVWRLGAPGLMG